MTVNTFSVIPTITLKKGSGSGTDYTHSGDTNYTDVDLTNLAYTVTIPIGWKLSVQATGEMFVNTGLATIAVAITDSSIVVQQLGAPGATGTGTTFSLGWVINGDGASHTVKLQYKTFTSADAIGIANGSVAATRIATMIFVLAPSN